MLLVAAINSRIVPKTVDTKEFFCIYCFWYNPTAGDINHISNLGFGLVFKSYFALALAKDFHTLVEVLVAWLCSVLNLVFSDNKSMTRFVEFVGLSMFM